METFEKIFGNTVELRLMEFFLPLNDVVLNIEEIGHYIKAKPDATKKAVETFVEWGILVPAEDCEIPCYKIDPKSSIVGAVVALNNAIIERLLTKLANKELVFYNTWTEFPGPTGSCVGSHSEHRPCENTGD
jgi:hypothetical protein